MRRLYDFFRFLWDRLFGAVDRPALGGYYSWNRTKPLEVSTTPLCEGVISTQENMQVEWVQIATDHIPEFQ